MQSHENNINSDESVNQGEEPLPSPSRLSTPFVITLFLLCACLVTVFAIVRSPHQQASQASEAQIASTTTAEARAKTQAEIQAQYLRILSEPHAGTRLARLTDFLAHTPNSTDTQAARVQHTALNMQEQRAWAHLSEIIYSLTTKAKAKSLAKDEYISQWGELIRQDQLKTLVLSSRPLSLDGKAIKAPRSQFTKGQNSNTLAGATTPRKPVKKIAEPKPDITTNEENNRVTPARIRYARKPLYPRHAKRRGINANITLSLTIDERGKVIKTRVHDIQAERYETEFIYAAKRAAKRSRFHPKLVDGEPVIVRNYKRKYKFRAK